MHCCHLPQRRHFRPQRNSLLQHTYYSPTSFYPCVRKACRLVRALSLHPRLLPSWQPANKVWYYRELYLAIKNKTVIYRNMSGTVDHCVKRDKLASVKYVFSRVESKLIWLSAIMCICGMRIRGGCLEREQNQQEGNGGETIKAYDVHYFILRFPS